MTSKLLAAFILVVLLVTPALPAISQNTEQAATSEQPDTQLIYGLHQEPDSLNGFVSSLGVSGEVITMITEGLFDVDPEGNWYPVLASEIPTLDNGGISSNELSITYKLRDDVTWSDGQPFTCDDVLFTFEAITHPTSVASIASAFSAIDSVTCPDDFMAVAQYKSLIVGAPYLFGVDILPRHVIDVPANMLEWSYNRQPIGTGPFRFVEWIPGDHITLVKNERYRGSPLQPKMDSILIRFVPPTSASLQMLREGQIDILWNYAPDEDFQAASEPAITVHARQGGGVEKLVLNLADPTLDATDDPLNNPHWALGQLEVRQAIELGIDKQAIVDHVPIAVTVGTSPLASGWAQCDIEPSTYDSAMAQSLLAEAGWTDQNEDGVRECNGCPNAEPGTPLRLEIQTTTGNEVREQVQTMLADMMAEIGIELVAENLPPTEIFGNWESGAPFVHGNYDMLMYTTGAGVEPQGVMWYGFHSSQLPTAANRGNGYNYSRWIDEEADAALLIAGTTLDPNARKAAYQTACERIASELPQIHLYNRSETHLARRDIHGFAVNPFAAQTWNVADWERVHTEVDQDDSVPISIEGQYSIPLSIVFDLPEGMTEPGTAELNLMLDLRTLTIIRGKEVVSASITVDASAQVTDEEPVTITVGSIQRSALQVATPTPIPSPTATPIPTATPTPEPVTGTVNRNANLRTGPGTDFDVAGSVQQGQAVEIVGQNDDGTWYQLSTGAWIAAFLVDNLSGDIPSDESNAAEAEAYKTRAFDHFSAGDYERALLDYSKVIELTPSSAEAFSSRGAVYLMLKDNEQAVADCTIAIELDPNFAAGYHNRSNAFLNSGNYEQAIVDSTKVIELEPEMAHPYVIRGESYFAREEYALALDDFEEYLKRAPDAPNRDHIEERIAEARAKLYA